MHHADVLIACILQHQADAAQCLAELFTLIQQREPASMQAMRPVLHRAAHGSAADFDLLIQVSRRLVLHWSQRGVTFKQRRLFVSPDDGDDISQEVALRLSRKFFGDSPYRPDTFQSYLSFLYVTTASVILNRRRQQHLPTVSLDAQLARLGAFVEPADPASDPASVMGQRESMQCVLALFADRDEQRAFFCKYILQQRAHDAALLMGVPVKQVYALNARVRQRINQMREAIQACIGTG